MNISKYKNLIKPTKKKKQVAALFSVSIIGIPLGIVSNIIVTRFLGSEKYGDLSFLLNIFNLSILLFTFGFFQAGNRALVLTNDEIKAKEYYGAELVYGFFIFLIMSVALFAYVTFDPNIVAKGLRSILYLSIPFGWVFLLLRYFETLFLPGYRIKELSFIRLMPKILYFILVLGIYFLAEKLNHNRLIVLWFIRIITFLIIYLLTILRLKPSFSNLKERIHEIWEYNKSYGLHVYSGSVFSVGFNSLTGILISYFSIKNTGVGYFGLAMTFSAPLALIPSVIATTHYKDFSTLKRIPKKLTVITISISILALIFVRVAVGPFIRLFYGDEFIPVIKLNLLVSTGVILHGMADYFNRFLGAHGEGKALRNSAILIGISLLAFNLILIPKFGETGAAYTKIFSGSFYFVLMILYYFKLKKTF